MKITINKKKYNLKYTLRALFIFEQITGKTFEIKTITDEYIFLYCLILANNPEADLTFDQLIDYMDNDNSIIIEYLKFMKDELAKQNQFNTNSIVDDKKKS